MDKSKKIITVFAIIMIMIGISLALYFFNKPSEITDSSPPTVFGPQIEVESIDAVFNPDNKDNVSGYMIEGYAAEGNIDYISLSKNVDISIKWSNQSGFENINELIFKRYVDTTAKATKTLNRATDAKYFKTFEKDLVVSFPGSELNYSVIGVNKIKIFYKNNNVETELTPTSMQGVTVSSEDLTQTLDSIAPVVVVYKPAVNNEITVSPNISKTGYYLYPGGINKSIQEYVVAGTPHGQVYLTPSGTSNTIIKVKVPSNNKYIKYNTTSKSFEFSDTGTEFKLVKGEVANTLRLKDMNADSFIVIDGTGKLTMLNTSDISTREVYNTLDIVIRDTGLQKVNCNFVWDEGAVDKNTGKRKDTYRIITPPAAGGTACTNKNGDTKYVNVPINCEGNWNNWGNCSKTCNGGTQSRTWNTTVSTKNNGSACPATQSQVCNTQQFNEINNDLGGGNDVIGYYTLDECKRRCASNNTGQKYTCKAFLHRSDNNACRIYNTQSPSGNKPGGYTAWLRCLE